MSSPHILVRPKRKKKKKNGTKDLQRGQRTHAFIILTRNHYLMVKVKRLNNSGSQTHLTHRSHLLNGSSHRNIKALYVLGMFENSLQLFFFFHNIPVIWCCIKNTAPQTLKCGPARLYSWKCFPCSPIFKTPWAAGKESLVLKCTIVRDFFWKEAVFY